MERIINAPTPGDLKEWYDRNPLSRIQDAAGDLEGNIGFLSNAVDIFRQLIQPIADQTSGSDHCIDITQSQANALYGALTHLEHIQDELDGGIKDLYREIWDATGKALTKK